MLNKYLKTLGKTAVQKILKCLKRVRHHRKNMRVMLMYHMHFCENEKIPIPAPFLGFKANFAKKRFKIKKFFLYLRISLHVPMIRYIPYRKHQNGCSFRLVGVICIGKDKKVETVNILLVRGNS